MVDDFIKCPRDVALQVVDESALLFFLLLFFVIEQHGECEEGDPMREVEICLSSLGDEVH